MKSIAILFFLAGTLTVCAIFALFQGDMGWFLADVIMCAFNIYSGAQEIKKVTAEFERNK